MPGGTVRNWDSYGHKIAGADEYQRKILADPQTSGGLLVAIQPGHEAAFEKMVAENGFNLKSFGVFTARKEATIIVTSGK